FPVPRKIQFEKQAAMARGSAANQTPASRSRVSPSGPSGRTTRTAGTAVILTIAALAEAVARKTCRAFHHGGKATATISAPGRTSSDNVAVAMKLAASNAVAFSQEGHRHDGIAFAGVIQQEIGRAHV